MLPLSRMVGTLESEVNTRKAGGERTPPSYLQEAAENHKESEFAKVFGGRGSM